MTYRTKKMVKKILLGVLAYIWFVIGIGILGGISMNYNVGQTIHLIIVLVSYFGVFTLIVIPISSIVIYILNSD